MASTTRNRKSSSAPAEKKNGKPKNGKKNRRKTVDDWQSWSRHLLERERPLDVAKLIAVGKKSPLLWALPQVAGDDVVGLIRYLGQIGSPRSTKRELVERLEQWLDQSRDQPHSVVFAYECLAWCHALPELARHLSAGPWWQLLERLREIAAEAHKTNQSAVDPLADQLLAGELQLTIAYLFPEVDGVRELAKAACRRISSGLNDLLDGAGLPKSRELSNLRPLMASWLRSSYIDRDLGAKGITGGPAMQFDWLVRQAIRVSRYDGSQMLSQGASGHGAKRLFEAALRFTEDLEDRAIANQALPGGKTPPNKQRKIALPEADANSEWAEVAVLRSSWSRSADRLLVTYGERTLNSELFSGRGVIWSGNCDPQLKADGQALSPTAPWQEVCWHSDDDVSYVELECPLTFGWKIQRQWLLARDDRFLFVADAMISQGSDSQQLEYRCTWPLADGVRFAGEAETREGFLGDERPLGRVIPMALPEWRCDRLDASLGAVEDGVQLFQTGRGRALYAPLFVDLSSRRLDKPLTWRRLTVADKLEIQPKDVAVGYRVQVGKSQWLIYRSLTPARNRSVLGQNLSAEFFLARFKKSGETEELLEIA